MISRKKKNSFSFSKNSYTFLYNRTKIIKIKRVRHAYYDIGHVDGIVKKKIILQIFQNIGQEEEG